MKSVKEYYVGLFLIFFIGFVSCTAEVKTETRDKENSETKTETVYVNIVNAGEKFPNFAGLKFPL